MKLLSFSELVAAGFPYGEATAGVPLGNPDEEIYRTCPDRIVYKPKNAFGHDTGNEHLLVFPSPDRSELLALWLQCTKEGFGDEHVVLARSKDGVVWSEPIQLAGSGDGETKLAKCAFPLVSRSGRIYILYIREHLSPCDTSMAGIYSDDGGNSWSAPQDIPMKRTKWDNPGEPTSWIVWQIPQRDASGCYLTGVTITTGDKIKARGSVWAMTDTRGTLMRFENIDDNPEPRDIRFVMLPEDGLTVDNPFMRDMSTSQEPAFVMLPDGRLFIVMRTMTGSPYYSVASGDLSEFSKPEILRYGDGTPVLHPLSPCPIYELKKGKYLILIHNNPGVLGRFDQGAPIWDCNYANYLRNPTYYCIGAYAPKEKQPVRFERPKPFADDDGVAVGAKRTAETAVYTSMTHFNGERVLWYPDRKFYLLGKLMSDEKLGV